MFAAIIHGIPIILGFLGKFLALKAQDNKEIQERNLVALNAQAAEYKAVREIQSPAANGTRRLILVFLMAMMSVFVLGFALFEVPIYVEEVRPKLDFLFGIISIPESISWTEIKGIPAFKDFFSWMAIIIEFWFGAQLAKRG